MSKATNMGGPEWRDELGRRIRVAVSRVGTQTEAAAAAGVSLAQLKRYMSGPGEVAFAPMARLARHAGVSLDWLAFGQGGAHESQKGLTDDLLAACLAAVEEHLSATDQALAPEKKAELVVVLARMVLEEEGESGEGAKPRREWIARFVKLAS